MSVLNISQIMEILPHRQPMLLIDSVEEIEYGVRAVAKKCVSFNEPFFAGHFPEEPLMCHSFGLRYVTLWRHWRRPVRSQSLEKMKTVEKQLILRPSILQNLKEK